MKTNLHNQQGFSLIEVLVTVFVIGMTVVIYAVAMNTVAATREAKHGDVALRIANHQLEALRAGTYASLPASGSFTDSQMNLLQSGAGTMTISVYNAKTKLVTVTVSWQEQARGARSVSLSTLITQTGGLK